MPKFERLFARLLAEGIVEPNDVHEPQPVCREWLELAHTPEYVTSILARSLDRAGVRRLGLPLSTSVVRRARAAVGGTVLASRLALQRGIACNVAGGSHHAFAGHGAGYCVFNDVAVAARVLLREGLIDRALVVDLDVHQGDGTAVIFADDATVFTFSMHCSENFPAAKQRSDRDVALPAGTGDARYLRTLRAELDALLPQVAPGLVFYNAGVDPHEADRLGKLSLTDGGIAARDRLVLESCARRSIPVVGVVGGGYAADVEELAYRHAFMYREAARLLTKR